MARLERNLPPDLCRDPTHEPMLGTAVAVHALYINGLDGFVLGSPARADVFMELIL
jgi:hypothetical protein